MYSDVSMEEMAADSEFDRQWMVGLAAMLKRGINFQIIHNLNRPFNEMMLGLQSWIPLYMTGQVQPYYLIGEHDKVFRHLYHVSNVAAVIGTVLGVQPLLREDGAKIVGYGKTRGRKKALRALADEFINRYEEDPDQCVSIAHGGCAEDAEYVASMMREAYPGLEIDIQIYEPVTGSYVGPGTVAMFYIGKKNL